MPSSDSTATSRDLDAAIDARLNAIDAPNTRRANRTALRAFERFLERERGVDHLDDLSVTDCRRFAEHLRDRSRLPEDDERSLSASTARQYYERVRATCTYWVEDEQLDANPAGARRATNPLPEDTEDPDRQVWTRDQREQLLRYTDRVVDETLTGKAEGEVAGKSDGEVPGKTDGEASHDEAPRDDVLRAYRDRTLAYLLAWTGVRGGEILRDPMDEARDGLRWADVSEDGVLAVLGKSRETEYPPLREPVRRRLDRWRAVLEPPTDAWPVFPVLSKGPLRRDLEERLDGSLSLASDAAVDARLAVYRREGLVPPSISTNAGRGVMRRLTESADVDVEEGYLQPHGGRRGLGDAIYDEDPVMAQDTLRHKSIETTHEAYRDKQQARLADSLDRMFPTTNADDE